jgi:GntR family transcriptional regulator, transcriptional repressor for pyruvate dehydrogenase complex
MSAGFESATDGRKRERQRPNVVGLPGIEKVAPVRIADDVAEQIASLIASEQLDAGARLPSERELAGRFGASRPTISQALRRLSVMGMVEIRRGSGAYVMRRPQVMVTESVNLMLDLDRHSVGDLMQLRLWLESMAIEHATGLDHPLAESAKSQLTAALDRLEQASSGSASQWIAADTVFHAAIVGIADNSYLTALYESVHTALLTYEYDEWLRTAAQPKWIHASDSHAQVELHRSIMTAVVNGQLGMAKSAVLAHHHLMLAHLRAARGAGDATEER